MNSPQIAFGLERAAWPALLVNDRGLILRANAAAIAAFGPIVSGNDSSLSAIWSAENGVQATEFLKHWEQTPMPVVMLKFRSSNGASMNFTTSISTFNKDNQKWYVLQLVLATAPTPTANLGSDPTDPVFAPSPLTPPPFSTPQTTFVPRTPAPTPTIPVLRMAGSAPYSPPPQPAEHKDPEAPRTEERPMVADANGMILKQKLDCALQLARTVSLDFNNALTSILGHASFLLGKSEPGHPWRQSLMEIEKSASHAAEVANELAIFSLQEKETRRVPPGNVNLVVGRCIEFFRNSHGDKFTWDLHLEKNLYESRFDEAKVQQALTKVMENAVEAITGSGQISVQTRNLELSEPTNDGNVRLSPGLYVCTEVSDSGPGIAPEVLPRVFEPFFTTKTANHRGLGLALVYGIITNHGGGVAISNQTDGGATVRIYLPAENQRVNEQDGAPDDDLHGTGTVLVVDDEDFLLSMTETILTEYGYRVLSAGGGAKALAILARDDGAVNLVVTDLVMPGMGGRELIERIKQLAPGTKILCMSGCVPPIENQIGEAYLRKPFTSEELLSKVKHTIGTTPALTAK